MTATIAVAGISHLRTTTRCAGTSGRDSLHLAPEDAVALARSLAAGGREAAVLVTCSRTEVYLSGADDAEETARRALTELGAPALASPSVYSHDGEEAARHLFRVAAGLESIVPGDPHVTAQVRQAHQMARDAGTTGPLLDRLFEGASATSKRIRSRTSISSGATSIPAAAIALAAHMAGPLAQRRLLIIGAGKIAQVAAVCAWSRACRDITVANRTVGGQEAGQPRRRRPSLDQCVPDSPPLTSLSPPPPAAASSSPRNISTVPGRSSSSTWPSPLTCTPRSRWSVGWLILKVWPGSYRRAPSTGGPISSGPP